MTASPNALAPLIAVAEPLIRTIVEQAVAETLRRRDEHEHLLGGRLWVSEGELASLCGLPVHRIQDCRYRGEIVGSKIGRAVGYDRDEVLRFLRERRID